MHIVHFTEYFHPRIGGVERHVLSLSQELARRGHEVSVVTRRYEPSLAREERVGTLRVLRLVPSGLHRAGNRLACAWLVTQLPLLRQADLIHVHDPVPFFRWYLPWMPLLRRKPVYLTFHGHEGNWPPAVRDVLARRAAVHLIRGSICVGHYLEKWYGTRSQAVTYGAVKGPEEGRELPVSRADPSLGRNAESSRRTTALFLGRLEPDTGVLDCLAAVHRFSASGRHPIRLVVCGQGPLEQTIREYAARHSLHVELKGAVPEPAQWIRESRFVFASGYLSMLEGMICRRLVLASCGNPLKRDYWLMLPGARGMMIVGESPEQLCNRLSEIFDRPDQEQAMVDRAYAFARAQTWKKLADTYLELYARS